MTTSHRHEGSKGARRKGELGVLQQRIADLERLLKSEHRQAEAEKWQILHYINERVKELDCLYRIHEIGMRPNLTIREFFREVSSIIPQSWQYPEVAACRIKFDNEKYMTPNFRKTAWTQESTIYVQDKPVGSIEVCYLEEKPDKDEGPFLQGERRLIYNIAKQLSFFAERKQAEEALRESREILRFVFESIGEGITIIDLNGNVVEVNDAALRIQGYETKEEVIGRNSLEFIAEHDRLRAKNDIRRAIEEGRGAMLEYKVVTKDGRERDIAASATIMHDSSGNPVGLISAIRDITESKLASELLQEERNRAQKYLDIASVIFLVIDSTKRVILINKKGCDVLGYNEREIVGKNWFENFVPHSIRSRLNNIFDRLLAGEVAPVEYYENSVLTKDGDERLIAWHNTILTDEIGNIIGTLSSGEDITEHRHADEALKKSEKRYRELFNSASDAIILRDFNGDIFQVNRAATELTGYTFDEMKGMNISRFLTPESFEITMNKQRQQLAGEVASHRYELELVKKTGEKAFVEAVISIIMEDAKPVAVQATVRDVTEQRKLRDSIRFYLHKVLVAQEEERKRIALDLHDDTSQSLLLLTHQLDAVVSNFEKDLAKPIRDKIDQSRNLAVETLNGVRRYAQELRPAILDDMGLVAALEWIADRLHSDTGIKVEVGIDIPEIELSHDVQLVLFRIAQEALGNIKRHAGASKAAISLKSKGSTVSMTITDNGKGFTVPPSLSDIGGSGKLGLIGMQERAQLLGGTVGIASRPKKGTTVTVEIPI